MKGVGAAVPFFVPPILDAVIAVLLAPDVWPMIAYISGTLGVLIRADILGLKQVKLGAPVASIGGARTFDAIFLTGIMPSR